MWVGIGVVPYFMTFLGNFPYHVRVFFQPEAGQKEGCLDVVIFKYLEDFRGVVGSPAGIEADGHFLFRGVHVVDGDQPVLTGSHGVNMIGKVEVKADSKQEEGKECQRQSSFTCFSKERVKENQFNFLSLPSKLYCESLL